LPLFLGKLALCSLPGGSASACFRVLPPASAQWPGSTGRAYWPCLGPCSMPCCCCCCCCCCHPSGLPLQYCC
jgi:hypothetical protein